MSLQRVRSDGNRNIYGELPGDYKTFDKGENVVLTVEEVLDIAGLSSLEQRHQHAMNVYPSSNSDEELIYRLTGVEIDLDFQYVGSIGSTIPGFSNVECILTISIEMDILPRVTKWATSGIITLPKPFDQAEFRDRFFRGLYFSLNAGGIVGVFDFFNLIVVVTSVSILLALSATAVSMIAYGLFRLHFTCVRRLWPAEAQHEASAREDCRPSSDCWQSVARAHYRRYSH